MTKRDREELYSVPIWTKMLLTIDEASAISGLGTDKLRQLSDDEECPFVMWNGSKRLFKRTKLEEYLIKAYSI